MAADIKSQLGSKQAWFIWSLAALVFFYAFIQRVAPGVMVNELMVTFGIGATVTGTLSALYFYPYVLLQIPIGALIQQIGPRILLTISLCIAGLGSAVFASSESIYMAYLGRVLVGIGSAVGFLGSLAIASKWFHNHQFAFLSGLVMLFGMCGGILAQTPLSLLIEMEGWRNAMLYLGLFGFFFAGILFVFIRNEPVGAEVKSERTNIWSDTWFGLTQAFKSREVWKVAIVGSTMSGPMLTFGGLWAAPYLSEAFNISRTEASSYTSLLFVGWAVGAPFFGWLSDRIQKRKLLLNLGSGTLCILVAIICFVPNLPLFMCIILFIGIGFNGAAMTVCFALARDNAPQEINGSVIGIVNSMTVASGAILQPAVGYILDTVWDGTKANGINVYVSSDYRTGFLVILFATLIGFLLSLALKESRLMQAAN